MISYRSIRDIGVATKPHIRSRKPASAGAAQQVVGITLNLNPSTIYIKKIY